MTCLVQLKRGGEHPAFTRLDGPEAAGVLNRFSYLPRFGGAPWTKADHARHFSNCLTLAQQATVGTLQIPANLDRLDETVQMMRATLREMSP